MYCPWSGLNTSETLQSEGFFWSHPSILFLRQSGMLMFPQAIRVSQQLMYVPSLCCGIKREPTNTGGLLVFLFSNLRLRLVVTVRLMFLSKILHVGSRPKAQNSLGFVQNWLTCCNCRSLAKTRNRSGWMEHSRVKTASLEVSSSRLARFRSVHTLFRLPCSFVPFVVTSFSPWKVLGADFLAKWRALYRSPGPRWSCPTDLALVMSPTERYTSSRDSLAVLHLINADSFSLSLVLDSTRL